MKKSFDIKGMTCSACSSAVNKAVSKLDAVHDVTVNLMSNSMTVEYDDTIISDKDISNAVKDAGYSAQLQNTKNKVENEKVDIWEEQLQSMLFRLKVSIPLTIILMYISMGHMINLPLPEILEPHKSSKIYSTTLFILTIPFLIYGFDILKSGYNNLMHKMPNMDTLVSIGVIIGLIYSIYNMYHIIFNNNHHLVMNLYFESSAIIIYFVKLRKIY